MLTAEYMDVHRIDLVVRGDDQLIETSRKSYGVAMSRNQFQTVPYTGKLLLVVVCCCFVVVCCCCVVCCCLLLFVVVCCCLLLFVDGWLGKSLIFARTRTFSFLLSVDLVLLLQRRYLLRIL